MKPKEFNLLTSNSKRFARVFKEIASFNLELFIIFTNIKYHLKNLVRLCR